MTKDDEGYQHEVEADGDGEAKAYAHPEVHDGLRRDSNDEDVKG